MRSSSGSSSSCSGILTRSHLLVSLHKLETKYVFALLARATCRRVLETAFGTVLLSAFSRAFNLFFLLAEHMLTLCAFRERGRNGAVTSRALFCAGHSCGFLRKRAIKRRRDDRVGDARGYLQRSSRAGNLWCGLYNGVRKAIYLSCSTWSFNVYGLLLRGVIDELLVGVGGIKCRVRLRVGRLLRILVGGVGRSDNVLGGVCGVKRGRIGMFGKSMKHISRRMLRRESLVCFIIDDVVKHGGRINVGHIRKVLIGGGLRLGMLECVLVCMMVSGGRWSEGEFVFDGG